MHFSEKELPSYSVRCFSLVIAPWCHSITVIEFTRDHATTIVYIFHYDGVIKEKVFVTEDKRGFLFKYYWGEKFPEWTLGAEKCGPFGRVDLVCPAETVAAVSYTHLTLPTMAVV